MESVPPTCRFSPPTDVTLEKYGIYWDAIVTRAACSLVIWRVRSKIDVQYQLPAAVKNNDATIHLQKAHMTESSSEHFPDSNLSVKPVVHSQEKEVEERRGTPTSKHTSGDENTKKCKNLKRKTTKKAKKAKKEKKKSFIDLGISSCNDCLEALKALKALKEKKAKKEKKKSFTDLGISSCNDCLEALKALKALKEKKKSFIDLGISSCNDCLEALLSEKKPARGRGVKRDATQMTNAAKEKYDKDRNMLPTDAGITAKHYTELCMRPGASLISITESAPSTCAKTVGFLGIDTEHFDDGVDDSYHDGPGFELAGNDVGGGVDDEDYVVQELEGMRKVDKVRVSHATVATKVDVKRLKKDLWDELEATTNSTPKQQQVDGEGESMNEPIEEVPVEDRKEEKIISFKDTLLAQPGSSSPEKEKSSSSLKNVEESARRLFAKFQNNEASRSPFNDQSLVVLADSGKKAHRAIKHDCLIKNEGVRIVKRNPNGQIYFVEDLHKHVHCTASSKQSADLQTVCKNVEVIETNANVFQEDFAVWNVDDEEHPLLEDTAKLIQKVFVGFQTAMQVPQKDNVRGTIATNVGLTRTDSNQYSENRTTILETVKPFLTKLVCITHQPHVDAPFHTPNVCNLSHSLEFKSS